MREAEIINDISYSEEYYSQEFAENENKSPHYQNKVSNVMSLVLPIRKGERVLDIGTCSGTFAFESAKYGANVVGTDLSEQAISHCRQRMKAEAVGNVDFVVCSADEEPFDDASFDKVIMGDVAEHLPFVIFQRTLRESMRLLKPGGKLIVYTPNASHYFEFMRKKKIFLSPDPTHINLMTMATILGELRGAGFEIQTAKYRPSHFAVLGVVESMMMKLPALGKYFGRRVCGVAVKAK